MGAYTTGWARLNAAIRRPSTQERDTAAESQQAERGGEQRKDGTGHKRGLCVFVREDGCGRGA